MKPTVITIVDDKMLSYAEEQAENVRSFGLDHTIIRMPDVESYSPELWVHMWDLTMDAIHAYGKIMRLDAEVRLHKSLPVEWIENDNVFFRPYPITKKPYIIINTGQIILGKSSLEFCQMHKECMLAMVPPGSTLKDNDFHFDEEYIATFSIRLSRVNYFQENLKMDRSFPMQCSVNRGTWIEESTIMTHPGIHNWSYINGGMYPLDNIVHPSIIINHFDGKLEIGMLLVKLMLEKKTGLIWNKLAKHVQDDWYYAGGWYFNPSEGLCSPKDYWPKFSRRIKFVPDNLLNNWTSV